MKGDIIVEKEFSDRERCFAWRSAIKCSALKKKECKNCKFYKPKSEVLNYEQYLRIKTINKK